MGFYQPQNVQSAKSAVESINKIKGFHDLLPGESEIFTRMEDVARRVFSRYGYREIRLPLLEKTELFARSIGEETDVVQKEMFTFPDRKGALLTLRPEATAGVARAYIEDKLHAQDRVCKLFTFGPMFRYERPQKGRQRQFNQIDVECLGAASPLADAEMLLMLWSFLSELGLQDLAIELNSLGCAECRPTYKDRLTDFFGRLDHARFCEDCRRRVGTNPLRVLDCKVPGCREMTRDAPEIADSACPACRDHFASVRRVVDKAGVPYRLAPRLVRGLDYYQRTTFEITSGRIGAQTAVAGGGRYDGLVKALGGPDHPGVGFACGMERLAMLMPPLAAAAPDFFVAALDEAALLEAADLAGALRNLGLRGECAYEARSFKSQLRQANKTGAARVLIIGPDELARGVVQVKDMTTGAQAEAARAALLDPAFWPNARTDAGA